MQETGLSKHFSVLINDDCWQSARNSTGFIVPDPARFPNGYEAVVEKLKDYQIESGLYSARKSPVFHIHKHDQPPSPSRSAPILVAHPFPFTSYQRRRVSHMPGAPRLVQLRGTGRGVLLRDRPHLHQD